MNTAAFSRVLDAVARDYIPEDINLCPRLAAKLERRTFMQSLRARPALMILFVVLALTLLTGVVYAVGRSLGYIPGVGIIEQGAPIRVLAEPVSVTRDGITLTVSEAVLISDKTVVLFTLENVPRNALSHDENVSGCPGMAELHLPDGTVLQIVEGGGSMGKTRFVYAPIPADVNEAVFVLPCIANTLPGLAPENWELPLHFIPAPPDMTVVPVIEIEPTAAPESTETAAPVQITQALQVGDEYVVVGKITDHDAGDSWVELTGLRLTDANGAEIYAQLPTVEVASDFDWGVQFKAGAVAFPLTFAFDWVRISPLPDARAEFEFDAGENPQPGQEWTLNLPIQIGGRTVTLETVQADSRGGYNFIFTSDPDVTGISLEIAGHTPLGGGGGGGYGLGQFSVGQTYAELPKGKLHVVLSNLTVASPPQTWTLEWSPENPPEAASLYGISLRLDKFVPLEDGYYLIGHTEWTDERIAGVTEYGTMQAFDASGLKLSLEQARFAEAVTLVPDLQANQWVYRLYGTSFNGPVTLRLSLVNVEFKQAVRFRLDLQAYGFTFAEDQIGVPWKTGLIPLDVPGLNVLLARATYVREGNRHGFEFGLEADPRLQTLALDFEEGVTNEQGPRDSQVQRDPGNGLLLIQVLTDGQLSMPIGIVAYGADVSGRWETTWVTPER